MWRLHRYLSFPDGQIGWLPFALLAALRAWRRGKCEVVYSTGMPITAHLVAGIVKRLTGVPWVAEFRDPWLGNPITEALAGRHPWLYRRLQVRLERWIIRTADRIVFVSPSTTRLYRKRYPGAEMVTITNGHDSGSFTAREAAGPSHDGFRLVYTGSLRPDELSMFLAALQAVVARRPDLQGRLEVAFYGDVSDACQAVAAPFLRNETLGAIVRFHGFVPRQAALAALADADAALLMLGPGPGIGQQIPSKIFDILGMNQQVLAILPPGDARDILSELDWGVIADPDEADIEQALEHLLASPRPTRVADPDGRYDGAALTARLANTLCDAAGANGSSGLPRSRPTAVTDAK